MNIKFFIALIALFCLASFASASCAANEYLVGDDCTVCPIGKYCDGTDAFVCAGDLYNDEAGQISCKPCATGSFTTEAVEGEGNTVCSSCPIGKFCDGDAATNCAGDLYNDEAGQTTCKPCASGSFTTEAVQGQGNTECSVCVEGSFCDGAVSTLCPLGTFANNTAQESCDKCDLGTYASVEGSTYCLECGSGSYTTENHVGEGYAFCNICPVGKYCDGSVAESCTSNNYADVTGKESCDVCPAGSFVTTTGSGNVLCSICPVGSYCPNGIVKTACTFNTFSNIVGGIACDVCPPGKYVSNVIAGGNAACSSCPKGWVCVNGIDRAACSDGLWTENEGSQSSASCSAEYCPTEYSCVGGTLVPPHKEWTGGHIALTIIAVIALSVAVLTLGIAVGVLLIFFRAPKAATAV